MINYFNTNLGWLSLPESSKEIRVAQYAGMSVVQTGSVCRKLGQVPGTLALIGLEYPSLCIILKFFTDFQFDSIGQNELLINFVKAICQEINFIISNIRRCLSILSDEREIWA